MTVMFSDWKQRGEYSGATMACTYLALAYSILDIAKANAVRPPHLVERKGVKKKKGQVW